MAHSRDKLHPEQEMQWGKNERIYSVTEAADQLIALIEPIVTSLGFELVRVSYGGPFSLDMGPKSCSVITARVQPRIRV